MSSQDRKTRTDGDRVIHTVGGSIRHGDQNEAPRGLTTEQANEQRSGTKLDERQTFEAAHGQQQSTPVGDVNRIREHAEGEGRSGDTDEVTTARAGVSKRSQSQ